MHIDQTKTSPPILRRPQAVSKDAGESQEQKTYLTYTFPEGEGMLIIMPTSVPHKLIEAELAHFTMLTANAPDSAGQ